MLFAIPDGVTNCEISTIRLNFQREISKYDDFFFQDYDNS